MGKFDNFLNMLKVDNYDEDDDYITENELAPEKPSILAQKNIDSDEEDRNIRKPVRPTQTRNRKGSTGMEVVRINPSSVEDGRKITDYLLDGKVVFLDLEGIDVNLAQRIIDFTSGATYAIDGTLQQMSKFTFVIAPSAVNVSGDFSDSNQGNTSVTF